MYHYLFTNDLRISNLGESLEKTGKAYVTDTVPSSSVDKSENNNMTTLGFYFNLTRTSKCALACSQGKVREVVLNFIKKFQFPNPRTPESMKDCINDGISLAPMRVILKTLYLMLLKCPEQAYLSRQEILDFIFYNSDIAKNPNADIFVLIEQILKFRKNQILPHNVDQNSSHRNWKHEDRQIREMTKVLTWSGCVSENEKSEIVIRHNNLTKENKALLFDILNYRGFWTPTSDDTYENNRATYQEYMDLENYEAASSEVDNEESQILKGGENIIIYGVPGCGKSHYIKKHYTGDIEENTERIVFHPDYTYSDFVGQILPDNDENEGISYPFISGPFTRILQKALNPDNKEKMFYLIIEEINRGNAPAIFGDIFQLLDRDASGKSKYTITNREIARAIWGENTENFRIFLPSNLTILATMNTADQNVFTLDTAFKRRWKMKSIENTFPVDEKGNIRKDANGNPLHTYADAKICATDITWRTFVEKINQKIIDSNNGLGTEDKRIGIYFATEEEINDVDLFAHKVLMYLWNDVFQYSPDKIFDANCKTLESLIAEFKEKKFGVFLNLFKKESSQTEQQ